MRKLRFKKSVLAQKSKDQIYDYFDSRKKQSSVETKAQPAPKKKHVIYNGCFSGYVMFWL